MLYVVSIILLIVATVSITFGEFVQDNSEMSVNTDGNLGYTLTPYNSSGSQDDNWPVASAPSVTTNATTNVTNSSATLNGYLMNDNGTNCTVSFEYGATIAYGNSSGIIGTYISSFDTTNWWPRGMCTNSINIWIVDDNDDKVYKHTMNGTYVSSFDTSACGNSKPYGLGTDGTNIWVTDTTDDEVYKYTMSGSYVSSFDTAACGNSNPYGLCTDGTNIWTTDFGDDKVYKYDMSGSYVSSFDTNACGNTVPYGMGTDGANIWVVDNNDKLIYKYTMNGIHLSNFNTAPYGNSDIFGVCSNGVNLWVTDYTDDEVYKYDIFSNTDDTFFYNISGLSPSTEYHYRSIANSGITTVYGSDMTFTTLSIPTNSNPSPTDDATGISLNPTLQITVNDTNGDTMNQSFWTNASGSWLPIAWNNNTLDATLSNTTTVFTNYSTKYFWSSNVTDSMSWGNDTYSFTTQAIIVYTNASTNVTTTTATLNGYLMNDNGTNCTVSFEYGATIAYGNTSNIIGTYISSFDTAAYGNDYLHGMCTDNTNIWVVDRTDDKVYKYTMDGTYISNFDTSACGNNAPSGIDVNDSNLFITGTTTRQIYKHTKDGTYVSSFDTSACGNTYPSGVCTDDTNFWVSDYLGDLVYKYDTDGTYISNFDTAASGNTYPYGIETDGTNLWTANWEGLYIYKYAMDGTYNSRFYMHPYGIDGCRGVCTNDTNIWVNDIYDDKVFKFDIFSNTNDTFFYNASALSPSTTYHYRAVANSGTNTVYGDDITFTTTTALSEWGYREEFTINSSYIQDTLEYFPVLVDVVGNTNLMNYAQNDFDDVLFTSHTVSWVTGDSEDRFSHEIESYNSTTGNLTAWVKIPSVSSTSNTVFYMYCGNPTCINQEQENDVWSNGFVAVQHMEETSGNYIDSTSNGNTGYPHNYTGYAYDGQIDGSGWFEGNNDCGINMPNTSSLNSLTSEGTIGAWFYVNTSQAHGGIIHQGDLRWSDEGYLLQEYEGPLRFAIANNSNYAILDTDFNLQGTTLYYGVGTWNETGMWLYIDGSVNNDSTDTLVCGRTIKGNVNIGTQLSANNYNSYHYKGYIDEVRLSNVSRNESWVNASYVNQKFPSSFFVQTDNIYVDDNAPSSWYDNIHVHTITEAITNVSSDGTIYIYNGTYYGAEISKSVTIIGNSSSGTFVWGANSGSIFNISVNWTNISNLYFYDCGSSFDDAGITIKQFTNNCNISNCCFWNNTIGILCQGTETILSRNQIYNCSTCIKMEGLGLLNNNITVFNCTLHNTSYGILIDESAGAVVDNINITNCFLYNSELEGIGIKCKGSTRVNISETQINSFNTGIRLTNVSDVCNNINIFKNYFNCNGKGLEILNDCLTNSTIYNNTFYENVYGIHCYMEV